MRNQGGILKKVKKELIKIYNEKPIHKAQPRMRPSYIGTQCKRKIYYSYLRVETDTKFTEKNVNDFQNGDMQAHKLRNQLKASGLLIDYRDQKGNIPKHWKTGEPDPEFGVDSDLLNMKNAKIDGVMILKDVEGYEDGLWLLEIKTYVKDKEKWLKKPKDDHMEQGCLYVHTFEEQLNSNKYSHIEELRPYKEVKGIVFIYVCRDNDDWTWLEFKIPKEDTIETFLGTGEKLLSVMEMVENNELPPKFVHALCDYCPYRKKCDENYKVQE